MKRIDGGFKRENTVCKSVRIDIRATTAKKKKINARVIVRAPCISASFIISNVAIRKTATSTKKKRF